MEILVSMENQMGTSTRGDSVIPTSSSVISTHKDALKQLLETLKLPQSPDQKRAVLNILKSNPQLTAAFIQQRLAILHRGLDNPDD